MLAIFDTDEVALSFTLNSQFLKGLHGRPLHSPITFSHFLAYRGGGAVKLSQVLYVDNFFALHPHPPPSLLVTFG